MHRRFVVCLVTILIVFGSFINLVEMTEIGNSEPENIISQFGGSRGTHKRITINNNSDFTTITTAEGWSGNGTIGNPYIIENLTINANDGWHGIFIGNTTVYFVIQNCTITGATRRNHPYNTGFGISLDGVKNGRINNNQLSGNNYGINIYRSSDIVVENNNCSDNGNWTNDCGIWIYSSRYVIARNNICNNMSHGIAIIGGSFCLTIDRNTCNLNINNGIGCVRLSNSLVQIIPAIITRGGYPLHITPIIM